MSVYAIRAQHVGKCYRIGGQQAAYKTLRDSIAATISAPLRWIGGERRRIDNIIWALDDISFDIKHGEAVGIIGRNGSGKSTLLKILSRITKPTRGRVELYGRVGSLLEVGTGFHPELTGRENIYLNGAILGMGRNEIVRKFDEIVAFSEIDKFLDTPVKFYSSGMYVRLAFAVAAHLEPEILVVDEVLAVGDAEFQKKCLGKMGDVARAGRTVLFVSHNLQAVRQLCERAIYLASGKIVINTDAASAVDAYLQSIPTANSAESLEELIHNLPPDPVFRLNSISLTQNGQPVVNRVLNGSPLALGIDYQVLQPATGLRIFFDLCDIEGNILFRSFHDEQSEGITRTEIGQYRSQAIITENILAPISYNLLIYAGIHNERLCIPQGIRIPIKVEATGIKNRAYAVDVPQGKLGFLIPWTTEKE